MAGEPAGGEVRWFFGIKRGAGGWSKLRASACATYVPPFRGHGHRVPVTQGCAALRLLTLGYSRLPLWGIEGRAIAFALLGIGKFMRWSTATGWSEAASHQAKAVSCHRTPQFCPFGALKAGLSRLTFWGIGKFMRWSTVTGWSEAASHQAKAVSCHRTPQFCPFGELGPQLVRACSGAGRAMPGRRAKAGR